jgi:hypothetical protein
MSKFDITARLEALERIEEIVREVPLGDRLAFLEDLKERLPMLRTETAGQAVELAGGLGTHGAISRAAELLNTSRPTVDSLLTRAKRSR